MENLLNDLAARGIRVIRPADRWLDHRERLKHVAACIESVPGIEGIHLTELAHREDIFGNPTILLSVTDHPIDGEFMFALNVVNDEERDWGYVRFVSEWYSYSADRGMKTARASTVRKAFSKVQDIWTDGFAIGRVRAMGEGATEEWCVEVETLGHDLEPAKDYISDASHSQLLAKLKRRFARHRAQLATKKRLEASGCSLICDTIAQFAINSCGLASNDLVELFGQGRYLELHFDDNALPYNKIDLHLSDRFVFTTIESRKFKFHYDCFTPQFEIFLPESIIATMKGQSFSKYFDIADPFGDLKIKDVYADGGIIESIILDVGARMV